MSTRSQIILQNYIKVPSSHIAYCNIISLGSLLLLCVYFCEYFCVACSHSFPTAPPPITYSTFATCFDKKLTVVLLWQDSSIRWNRTFTGLCRVQSTRVERGETRVEKNTDEKREAKKREWHWDSHNHQ